jgi:hypothetical protein
MNDANPIGAVECAPIAPLTEYGFTSRFTELDVAGVWETSLSDSR